MARQLKSHKQIKFYVQIIIFFKKSLLFSVKKFLLIHYWIKKKLWQKFNIKKKVGQGKKLKSKTSKINKIKFYKGYKVKTKSSSQFR